MWISNSFARTQLQELKALSSSGIWLVWRLLKTRTTASIQLRICGCFRSFFIARLFFIVTLSASAPNAQGSIYIRHHIYATLSQHTYFAGDWWQQLLSVLLRQNVRAAWNFAGARRFNQTQRKDRSKKGSCLVFNWWRGAFTSEFRCSSNQVDVVCGLAYGILGDEQILPERLGADSP